MKVLVTGANGQVGSEVCAILEAQNRHDVLGLDLPDLDLSDRDASLGAVTSWQPDAIIHLAAMTAVDACESDPEMAYKVNCAATRFIADGARRVGAHVVYVSTDYVFDGTKFSPYVEWDIPNPESVYGSTKLGGEMEIDPGWSIARTSWVCGYHGNNMVKTLIRLAEEHSEVSFVNDQVGHPTFATDLAGMVLKLAVERVPGIFHTTNQGAVSWYEFAQAVFAAAGHDPGRVKSISTSELDPPRPAKRPANSVLDNLAWRLHGFDESRDFHEPLTEVVKKLLG